MSRAFSFSTDAFYHIYNRGTEKRIIFIDKRDYKRFITLLHLANQSDPVVVERPKKEKDKEPKTKPLVNIVSYCLMPNHYHILIYEYETGGISKFIQKLSTAYTMYFNKKYSHSGALFQGKFKAIHVNTDEYLQYLIAYIHLNPVALIDKNWKKTGIINKKKAQNFLQEYTYSSYIDYIGIKRNENKILSTMVLPKFFKKGENFEDYVTDWLSYNV